MVPYSTLRLFDLKCGSRCTNINSRTQAIFGSGACCAQAVASCLSFPSCHHDRAYGPSQSGTGGARSPPDVPRTWAVLSERSGVPLSTVHYRAYRRQSMEEPAQGRQYLTPEDEKTLFMLLSLTSDLGHSVRVD